MNLGEATTFPLIVYSAPLHEGHIQMAYLSRDSKVRVPKLQQLGLLQLWGRITSCANLRSQWGLKQSCSPRWDLFNGMLHVAWTHGIRVDSWLLVVGSQIANLTPGHSFDHNLCYRCPNGRFKPISFMYASRAFRWYRERLKARSFDPCNRALKIWESFQDSNSQHGSSLGSVRVHARTLFALSGACEVTPGSSFRPATFQPLAFITSPRLGLRHFECVSFNGFQISSKHHHSCYTKEHGGWWHGWVWCRLVGKIGCEYQKTRHFHFEPFSFFLAKNWF
jgi:hypothetical protein